MFNTNLETAVQDFSVADAPPHRKGPGAGMEMEGS